MTGHTATPRHPSVLHALSTAWSYQQARAALAVLAARETAKNVAEQLPAANVLRSPVWGSLRTVGGHGDPTGTVGSYDSYEPGPTRATWWTDRQAQAEKRITWLADQLAPGAGDPLRRLVDRIPALQPGTARVLTQHLADEDRWIRETVRLSADEQLLPGVECPACGIRPLAARTAAPDPADWTVVCQSCLCSGDGCGCGMPIRVEGVTHIWDQATPAVARWLARLDVRRAA